MAPDPWCAEWVRESTLLGLMVALVGALEVAELVVLVIAMWLCLVVIELAIELVIVALELWLHFLLVILVNVVLVPSTIRLLAFRLKLGLFG